MNPELSLEQIDNLSQSANVVLKQVAIQCAKIMRENERLNKLMAPCKHESLSMIAYTEEKKHYICNRCDDIFEIIP